MLHARQTSVPDAIDTVLIGTAGIAVNVTPPIGLVKSGGADPAKRSVLLLWLRIVIAGFDHALVIVFSVLMPLPESTKLNS